MYIPTHRKRRDGWGTRSVVAGEILGFALRANAHLSDDKAVAKMGHPDLWVSGEVGGGYGYRGYGGGFGSEDAGAEGYRLPVVLGEERHLFGGPAALGAYG